MRLVAADGWSVVGEMRLWRVVSSVARAKRDTHIIEYQQDNQSSCISRKAEQDTQRFINQGVADHPTTSTLFLLYSVQRLFNFNLILSTKFY